MGSLCSYPQGCKAIQTQGWCHLHKMENIMPGMVRCAYVFSCIRCSGTVGTHPQPVGVEDDSDLLPSSYFTSQSSAGSQNSAGESIGESQATLEGTQVTWANTQPASVATQEDPITSEDHSGSFSQDSRGASDNNDEEIWVTQVRILIITFGLHLKMKHIHAAGCNHSSSFKEVISLGTFIINQLFE